MKFWSIDFSLHTKLFKHKIKTRSALAWAIASNAVLITVLLILIEMMILRLFNANRYLTIITWATFIKSFFYLNETSYVNIRSDLKCTRNHNVVRLRLIRETEARNAWFIAFNLCDMTCHLIFFSTVLKSGLAAFQPAFDRREEVSQVIDAGLCAFFCWILT